MGGASGIAPRVTIRPRLPNQFLLQAAKLTAPRFGLDRAKATCPPRNFQPIDH